MRHVHLLSMAAGLLMSSAIASERIVIQGREVLVDASTQVLVDDQPLPAGAPLPQKHGLRVVARHATPPTTAAAPQGAVPAATLVFSYAVRGAVTSVQPLRVLGQEVTITADTGMTGVPGGSVANIALGDHLDVSGYIDTNSSLLASFIEYLPVATPRWLLSGYVTATSANEIALGPQRVSLAGVTPIDCGAAVDVGAFVEIRAQAVPNFTPQSVIDTVSRLTCTSPVPIATPGALGAMTGLVGEILSPTSFRFGAYVASFDAQTEFRFGSIDNLVTGAAIEIDGVFGAGGAFQAQGIQFDAPIIRLEGPVVPGDVQSGADGHVRVLGNTVRRSAQLRDLDGIYANGIASASQIELRGYLDRRGQPWATRARLRGAPDPADVRAAGPVEWVARPQLGVLGLVLDTTGATFENPAEQPIDADTFFAGALPGAIVEQGGALSGTGTIVGGVAALIAPLDPPPAAARQILVGRLHVDRLFTDGFDPRP